MILEQNFTLAKIGDAVGKNPVTLRTHINRGYVTGEGPRHVNGEKPAGRHSRFSFFTLMEFRLAYELYDKMGLQLDTSFQYARHFSHVSGGGAVFGMPTRHPSLPFHYRYGDTLLGIAGERSAEIATDTDRGKNLYSEMTYRLRSDDFILVNVSKVFERLCSAMSLHPLAVLDEAYPDEDQD